MGGSVYCNYYELEDVVVIYYDLNRGEWIIEEQQVVGEAIQLDSDGPGENQPYWVGKKFTSEVKTFPIVMPGRLNKKARISSVSAFLHRSHGGEAEVGNEQGNDHQDISYDDTELFSGRKELPVGSGYSEEPYVAIRTDGYSPFNLLALDVNYRKYEE